jgi:Reverse transcriptase (RNA-dependent DNA polymerase)
MLHALEKTYSSCVEQPIQRLFFALASKFNLRVYRVYGGDAKDAFAHSPPPALPTFVAIDDAYADWYEARHKIKLDRSLVLPVQHALQGHPESGRLWMEHIDRILCSPPLNFRSTTHDQTIYQTSYNGETVLLLRQVDDFALACTTESTAQDIYNVIGTAMQLPGEDAPLFQYLGLLSDYNGVDIIQASSHITISCENYIHRVLRSHGWDTPSAKESDTDHVSPLPMDALELMYTAPPGPAEHSDAHAALEEAKGFRYRTLLGELLYACVTCRCDIGYSITTLSKFASSPSPTHFDLLKGVAKYLRRTATWGLTYHRDNRLPHSDRSNRFDPSPTTLCYDYVS